MTPNVRAWGCSGIRRVIGPSVPKEDEEEEDDKPKSKKDSKRSSRSEAKESLLLSAI